MTKETTDINKTHPDSAQYEGSEFKRQTPDKDLQKWDDRHPTPAVQNDSASSMLMLAIQNKYSPEFIREMMDLRDREEARVKEQAHFKAFADFKKNPFDLIKDKINKQTGNSPYISVGKLLSIVNPELAKVGLIANFRLKDSVDFQHITVTCVLSHELGHSIESGMSAKVETTGPKGGEVMTEMHARLSALTYLMKATFSAVVGVAGQDKKFDDDGNKAGGDIPGITETQIADIETMVTDMVADKRLKDEKDFDVRLKRLFKVEKIDELTSKQADSLIKKLGAIK